MPRPDWMAQAKCATLDPHPGPNGEPSEVDLLFFNDSHHRGATKAGKDFCTGRRDRKPCPVIEQCLAYAIAQDERFGVWGGQSERGRLAAHRAARKARREQVA